MSTREDAIRAAIAAYEATPGGGAAFCFRCGSGDVAMAFGGYARACCRAGCTEEHAHEVDLPQVSMTCRSCGNAWIDGSGDYTEHPS